MKRDKLVTEPKKKKKTNFSTEKFVDIENFTPLSNRTDYLNALRHAEKMPKKNLIASLYVEVFQTKKDTFEITANGTGDKKLMVQSLSKAMLKDNQYFDLFMEAAASAIVAKAELTDYKKKRKPTNKKK